MRDGIVHERNANQMLLCLAIGFLKRHLHIGSLGYAESDATLAVANHKSGAKRHALSACGHARHAGEIKNFLIKFLFLAFAAPAVAARPAAASARPAAAT